MRTFFIILLSLTVYFPLFVVPENDSSTVAILYETQKTEAVKLDEQTLKTFQDDDAYDYYSIEPKTKSAFLQRIEKAIINFLQRLFSGSDSSPADISTDVVSWIITLVVIGILVLILIFFRPSLFYIGKKKKKKDYQVEDEDIQDADVDNIIKRLLDAGDFREAIRWLYLSVLKEMQEKEFISWNQTKTVNEYVRELKQKELIPDFKELSLMFLYFRYGHFDAERKHFDEVEVLADRIIKKVRNEA